MEWNSYLGFVSVQSAYSCRWVCIWLPRENSLSSGKCIWFCSVISQGRKINYRQRLVRGNWLPIRAVNSLSCWFMGLPELFRLNKLYLLLHNVIRNPANPAFNAQRTGKSKFHFILASSLIFNSVVDGGKASQLLPLIQQRASSQARSLAPSH